jgi:hypothetical protein
MGTLNDVNGESNPNATFVLGKLKAMTAPAMVIALTG